MRKFFAIGVLAVVVLMSVWGATRDQSAQNTDRNVPGATTAKGRSSLMSP